MSYTPGPRLIDHNPLFGTATWFITYPDGTFGILETQDAAPIVEANKAIYNAHDERARWRDTDRIASIPLVVYQDLKNRGIVDDDAAMKRWLNDSDNRFFRTRPGKI